MLQSTHKSQNGLNCPLIIELRMKGLSRIVSFNKQLVGPYIYIYIWTLCLRRACSIGPSKPIIEITILQVTIGVALKEGDDSLQLRNFHKF